MHTYICSERVIRPHLRSVSELIFFCLLYFDMCSENASDRGPQLDETKKRATPAAADAAADAVAAAAAAAAALAPSSQRRLAFAGSSFRPHTLVA